MVSLYMLLAVTGALQAPQASGAATNLYRVAFQAYLLKRDELYGYQARNDEERFSYVVQKSELTATLPRKWAGFTWNS